MLDDFKGTVFKKITTEKNKNWPLKGRTMHEYLFLSEEIMKYWPKFWTKAKSLLVLYFHPFFSYFFRIRKAYTFIFCWTSARTRTSFSLSICSKYHLLQGYIKDALKGGHWNLRLVRGPLALSIHRPHPMQLLTGWLTKPDWGTKGMANLSISYMGYRSSRQGPPRTVRYGAGGGMAHDQTTSSGTRLAEMEIIQGTGGARYTD